ncbi:MAG: hypothetical protein QM539_10460 [Alphaproteobacteria bacterium]|nr:hypothetical protein [Alphaproteobacteria bacterium]
MKNNLKFKKADLDIFLKTIIVVSLVFILWFYSYLYADSFIKNW